MLQRTLRYSFLLNFFFELVSSFPKLCLYSTGLSMMYGSAWSSLPWYRRYSQLRYTLRCSTNFRIKWLMVSHVMWQKMDESIRSRNTKWCFKAWRSRPLQGPCMIAYPVHVLHNLLWSGTCLFQVTFLTLNMIDLRASRCPVNTLWDRSSTPSARAAQVWRWLAQKDSMLRHQSNLIFSHVHFHVLYILALLSLSQKIWAYGVLKLTHDHLLHQPYLAVPVHKDGR